MRYPALSQQAHRRESREVLQQAATRKGEELISVPAPRITREELVKALREEIDERAPYRYLADAGVQGREAQEGHTTLSSPDRRGLLHFDPAREKFNPFPIKRIKTREEHLRDNFPLPYATFVTPHQRKDATTR